MAEIKFKIDISRLEQLRAAFGKYPDIVTPLLRKASSKSAFLVERNAKLLAPVDTGRLRSSIATSLGIANRGISSIVQTNVNYAAAVHEGSGPHWTSVANLEGWAKKRGINPHALQYSIATKKREGRPFMKQGVEASIDKIQEFYVEAVDETFSVIGRQ